LDVGLPPISCSNEKDVGGFVKIAIIVQTEPCTYQDFATAHAIALAALRKNHEVRVFLYDESVIAANKDMKMAGKRQANRMIKELTDRKIPIIACGACCMFRGITSNSLVGGVGMGGLTDLAEMIQWADRLVNFEH
jgi:sulfur relay (sulfurtransferase) complex TusBCD TusD component (DsrE family)